MRTFVKLLLPLLTIFIYQNSAYGQDKTVDYCVLVTAVTAESPASITLNWPVNTTALSYSVFKKGKYETTWTTLQTNLPGNSTSFTDNNVTIGQEYEYSVTRFHSGGFQGYGYISSAIKLPVVHSRGSILILIESGLKDSLSAEIQSLSRDLAGDGWKVLHRYVSKDSSPVFVNNVIAEAAKWANNPLRALYLLGHIPVPYSGNYGKDSYYSVPPDGHPDHGGAWPADVFYGTSPSLWSDNLTNENGSRAENKNYPKDGKYDQIEIPGGIAYHIGRVDLSKMSKFNSTETQLLKQYIQKSHDYRFGVTKTINKGLIDENFAANIGAFASTAWRNFSAFFGPENILDRVENGVDYFGNLKDSNYVFAYGTGGGSYTSAGGIGTTDDFVTKRGAAFNLLFGSYFGDWDVANSFLRAPLAAKENGLVSGWSGRPWWQLHHMALGETIGFSTWLSQSNRTTYSSTPFVNNIHVALMGDPTLRLYVMLPPSALNAVVTADKKSVNLSWTASSEAGLIGYYIYRASSVYGTYDVINNTPLTLTTFKDTMPFAGTCYYMVRAVKLQQTPSGSFYNLSQGSFAEVNGIIGQSAHVEKQHQVAYHCYPNPTNGSITISLEAGRFTGDKITVMNSLSQVVASFETNDYDQYTTINLASYPNGIYWIKYQDTVNKVVLQRGM